MTRYARAVRAFRERYFLSAVLRNDGSIAAAAREIGANQALMSATLRNAGIGREEIRAMLVNRALLEAGLPPRKPVESVKHFDQFDQIAGLPEEMRTA